MFFNIYQCFDHKIDFWLQKNCFFSKKCLLGWCEKVTFYITWITILSDELQKKNIVEKVFSRTIRFNRFRDILIINKVVILSKRFDVLLLFWFFYDNRKNEKIKNSYNCLTKRVLEFQSIRTEKLPAVLNGLRNKIFC